MKSHDWVIGPLLAAQQVVFGFLAMAHALDGHRGLAVANMAVCAVVTFGREARRQ